MNFSKLPRLILATLLMTLAISTCLVLRSDASKPGTKVESNSDSRTSPTPTVSPVLKSDAKLEKMAGDKGKLGGKSIVLPHYQPDFPPGEGREIFISRCGVCHSLRYITMQPDFSKKTWTKEVDKMIKTFGAHIDKKEATLIIDYLNSIKGKPAK